MEYALSRVEFKKTKKYRINRYFGLKKLGYCSLGDPNSSDQIQGLITLFFWGVFNPFEISRS